VMRRLRHETVTTVRYRAVSHIARGEQAFMIVLVQVRTRQWLDPGSGGPQGSQTSIPAPTD